MPILAVVRINPQGEKEVLGFTTGEKENQHAWQDLLADLKQRGVQKVDLWISDGNRATLTAIQHHFPDAQRQRCVIHKIDNVLGYVPKSHQDALRAELNAIFYHSSLAQAQQQLAAFCAKHQRIYPNVVAFLNRDIDVCLAFYNFSKEHWRSLCTNNLIERLYANYRLPD